MIKVPVRGRPEMPIRRLELRVVSDHRGRRHLVAGVLQSCSGGDRDKRQEVVGIRPHWVQEMRRHRRAREQVVRRRIHPTRCGIPAAAAAIGETLHPLQIKPVLLQMAGDVLAGQPVDAHQLHYRLRDSILDPQVGHGVDEPLVELRGPHEARPFQGPGRLVSPATGTGSPAAAAAAAAQVSRVEFRGGIRHQRRLSRRREILRLGIGDIES